MADNVQRLYYRVNRVEGDIRRAEAKLERLYQEARQYRIKGLCPRFVQNEAWEREVEIARTQATLRGDDCSTDQARYESDHG